MISVVVPLYNKQSSIEKTLSSIINQTFSNFEIIIVNDGSTDRSLDKVKAFKDERLKIINLPNGGVCKARNIGINNAEYDFIALLDADDFWHKSFLKEMHYLINDFPDASLYGSTSTYLFSDGNLNMLDYGLEKEFRGYISNYFCLERYNTLFNSSSVVFNKTDFFEIGQYDERLKIGEDIDLWFRFALNKKLAFLNKTLTYYNQNSENRASHKFYDYNVSLINTLEKFKEYENKKTEFKLFLDTWRLHNIVDYFYGRRTTPVNVKKVLLEIDNKNLSFFWIFLKWTPVIFMKQLFLVYSKYNAWYNLKRRY